LDNFDNKGRKVCCKVSLYNKSSAVAEMGDRLATIDMGGKLEAVSLFEGDLHGSPSNTMWPGPRPTCTTSFILIRPQYTNVADRQDMTDRQTQDIDNGPVAQGEPFHKLSPSELRSLTTDILTTFSSLDCHIFIAGLFFVLADILQSILCV